MPSTFSVTYDCCPNNLILRYLNIINVYWIVYRDTVTENSGRYTCSVVNEVGVAMAMSHVIIISSNQMGLKMSQVKTWHIYYQTIEIESAVSFTSSFFIIVCLYIFPNFICRLNLLNMKYVCIIISI